MLPDSVGMREGDKRAIKLALLYHNPAANRELSQRDKLTGSRKMSALRFITLSCLLRLYSHLSRFGFNKMLLISTAFLSLFISHWRVNADLQRAGWKKRRYKTYQWKEVHLNEFLSFTRNKKISFQFNFYSTTQGL